MSFRTWKVAFGVAIVTAIVTAPAALGDVVIQPGSGVRFSNGFTCSFRSKKTANAWLIGDPAFVGPTVICSGVSYRPWNSTTLIPVWVVSDGTQISELRRGSGKFSNRWGGSVIPPAGATEDPDSVSGAFRVGSPLTFKPVSNLVAVPDATLVRFGTTGVACGVFRAADSQAVLGYAMLGADNPEVFSACLTAWRNPRSRTDCIVWTAVAYGHADQLHFYRQRKRDSSGIEYTQTVGPDIRDFGCYG